MSYHREFLGFCVDFIMSLIKKLNLTFISSKVLYKLLHFSYFALGNNQDSGQSYQNYRHDHHRITSTPTSGPLKLSGIGLGSHFPEGHLHNGQCLEGAAMHMFPYTFLMSVPSPKIFKTQTWKFIGLSLWFLLCHLRTLSVNVLESSWLTSY